MSLPDGPPPIKAMQAEARQVKRESNGEFTYTEGLDLVARKYGFRNWQHVKSTHPEERHARDTVPRRT